MIVDRRTVTFGGLAAMPVVGRAAAATITARDGGMYGLITQLLTTPGNRDALLGILVEATKGMPGCLSYVVALDASRDDAVWVTEVWADKEAHTASLGLPSVRAAVTKGRTLISGVGSRAETRPISPS